MSKLTDLVQDIRNELGPEFISTDIVGMDGMSIAGNAANPDFDATAASARFAMVMKLASKVSDKLQFGAVNDNLVTTDEMLILTRFLGDSSYYWELVVSKDATLGMVRMLMDEYAGQLSDAIPH
jgi:predicted regulator of Ras-like GTPase activity (Roadblock/LC7/MglB family)